MLVLHYFLSLVVMEFGLLYLILALLGIILIVETFGYWLRGAISHC
jgi:hypothetical protein